MKKIHPIIIILAFALAAGVYFIQVSNFMSADSEKQISENNTTINK